MTKRMILYLSTLPLLALIFYINKKVDSTTHMTSLPAQMQSNPKNVQPVADPKNYAIAVSRDDVFRSQEEWTSTMSETLDQPELMEALIQQGIWEDLKNSPQKLQERIAIVEEESKQQEIRVRQFPTSSDEKKRLQSLYMLKATLKALHQEISTETSPQ